LSQNRDWIFEGRVVILYKSDRHSVCISALSSFYKSIWLSWVKSKVVLAEFLIVIKKILSGFLPTFILDQC
jgi:hypothetical protein